MSEIYQAFGLSIQSSLSLPELFLKKNHFTENPDVEILFGKTPEKLENPQKEGVAYQANPNEYLLDLEGIARYLVTDGNKITIQRKEGATDEDLRVFLLGSALGALLHQRETFILHASAIIIEGEAVLFTGISGMGKSTTSTAFRLEGNLILTDDVCAIQLNGKQKPIALPGYPQSKLWEDALEGMEMDYENLKHIREKINKRAVPLKDDFHNEPTPIRAIYWLNTHNEETLLLEEVKGAEKFNTLKQMTYRPLLVDGLGVKPAHFKQGMQLAMQVPVKKITRPTTRFSVQELVELVKEDLGISRKEEGEKTV